MSDPVNEAARAALALRDAIRRLPAWVELDTDALLDCEIIDPDLPAFLESWAAQLMTESAPATLADLLPWLARTPDPEHWHVQPWWGRAGRRVAFVTDGTAMLIVNGIAGAPRSERWSAAEAATWIDKVSRYSLAIPPVQFAAWPGVPRDARVRIGRAVYSARKIARWVGLAAQIAPGAVEIRPATDATGPVYVSGAGWRAIVMPLRPGSDGRLSPAEDAPALAPEVST